jgi:hypothetical protein
MQSIIALKEISVSELYAADKQYTEKFVQENLDPVKQVLFNLGLDTSQYYETQVNTHRNRLKEIYTGTRFVGIERSDMQWIKSGHASRAAIDKSSGSKLLTDLYSQKGLTSGSLQELWKPEQKQEEKGE